MSRLTMATTAAKTATTSSSPAAAGSSCWDLGLLAIGAIRGLVCLRTLADMMAGFRDGHGWILEQPGAADHGGGGYGGKDGTQAGSNLGLAVRGGCSGALVVTSDGFGATSGVPGVGSGPNGGASTGGYGIFHRIIHQPGVFVFMVFVTNLVHSPNFPIFVSFTTQAVIVLIMNFVIFNPYSYKVLATAKCAQVNQDKFCLLDTRQEMVNNQGGKKRDVDDMKATMNEEVKKTYVRYNRVKEGEGGTGERSLKKRVAEDMEITQEEVDGG